jgi:hypothetical protein
MAHGQSEEKSHWFTPGKILATLGVAVPVAAGVVALIFTFKPGLQPCKQAATASIEADVSHRLFSLSEFNRDHDLPFHPEDRKVLGKDVAYTVKSEGLRGKDLTVTFFLYPAGKGHAISGPALPGEDPGPGHVMEPSSCSDPSGVGDDLFVLIPEPGKRYAVRLELRLGTERLGPPKTIYFRA